MTSAIERFLTPTSVDELVSTVSGRKMRLLKGNGDELSSLLSWSHLNSLLGSLPPEDSAGDETVRIVRGGTAIAKHLVWAAPPAGTTGFRRLRLNETALHRALAGGATLGVNGLHHLVPAIGDFAESLSGMLETSIQVNGYASWRTESGFKTHWDGHDVLAIQLVGAKHWKVHAPTRPFPLELDTEENREAPDSPPIWEGDLTPGDILYVPRGWWHDAVANNEPSLHLTVGVHAVTGLDFLDWMKARLIEEEVFRRDLPMLQGLEASLEHMSRLKVVFDGAWERDSFVGFLSDRRRHFRGRPKPSLPFVSAEFVPDDVDPVVSMPLSRSFSYRIDGSDILHITDGLFEWELDRRAKPVLDLLGQIRQIHMSALRHHLANSLNEQEIHAVVGALVQEGIIAVDMLQQIEN